MMKAKKATRAYVRRYFKRMDGDAQTVLSSPDFAGHKRALEEVAEAAEMFEAVRVRDLTDEMIESYRQLCEAEDKLIEPLSDAVVALRRGRFKDGE
jgi:hypothetical protein